jgi:hypothetical protein
MATKKKRSSTRLIKQELDASRDQKRREVIATACLQGMLASGVFKVTTEGQLMMTAVSVELADGLIEELEADEDEEEFDEDEEDEDDE